MSHHHKATQHEKLYQPPNYFNKKLCAAHADVSAAHLAGVDNYRRRPLFSGLKQHIKVGFALGVSALSVWALTPPLQGYLSSPYKISKKKSPYKGHANSHSIWRQIAKDFTLSAYANNPAVLQQIRWYQEHPKSLSDIATQAAPYLYYVHQQVKEKGLPGELVLLPIIESAYNPFAYSHVGAAGLWQLMPQTGSDLGLKRNASFDGRRDVISSTQAALSYLDYLDKVFDKNWLLALAAYNSGPGTVLKADKNNKDDHSDTQFWSLHLPKETQQYVPRLLAVAAIISNPEKYGIQLPDVPNEPYFAKVTVNNPMPLSKVAKLSDTPVAEVHNLNPGYTGMRSTSATSEHVLIPIEKVETFKQNMNAQGKNLTDTTITPSPAPDNTALTYTVTANDTLRKVAADHHVNLNDLVKWNHLSRKSVLHKGQLLKLDAATTTVAAKAAHHHSAYRVRAGDTLGTIAKKQGIAVKHLHKANHLKSHHLKKGQVLKIPSH